MGIDPPKKLDLTKNDLPPNYILQSNTHKNYWHKSLNFEDENRSHYTGKKIGLCRKMLGPDKII